MSNKYIIIRQPNGVIQIAGPATMLEPWPGVDYKLHWAQVEYEHEKKKYQQHIDDLPRYDIPPSLQKEWEGRTEITEGVDFVFGIKYRAPESDHWIFDIDGNKEHLERIGFITEKAIFLPSGSPKQGIQELKATEEINEELGRGEPDTSFPNCTLNDADLVGAAREWVKSLCASGGRSWSLQVPVNLNKDPDILFCESGNRLLARNKRIAELEKENATLRERLSSLPDEVWIEVQKHEGGILSAPLTSTGWLKKINLKDLPGQQNDAVAFAGIFNAAGKFALETFPKAPAVLHLRKLSHECEEAIQDPKDVEEYADCFIALCGAAYKAGFSIEGISDAVNEKLAIIRNLEWDELPDGTYQSRKP